MFNWRKPTIYFLSWLQGSKRMRYFKDIFMYEKMSKEEIEKFQSEKLKKLLKHAYDNVPYYKRVLKEAGVVKKGEIFLENYNKIPILTKEIIRKEGKNLYSKDYKKRNSYENNSGGSTGEPVRFLQDRDYDDWNVATKLYYKYLGGQDLGDRELRLWGSERDLMVGEEKFLIRVKNWLYNRRELNTFKMSKADMELYVREWNKFKPTWIEAYVQSIYEFALFVKVNNLKVSSPRGILTSAGTLYPDMKDTIEEVFNCKVYNRYASREVGAIAFSCLSTDGLHSSFFHTYLEVLDEEFNEKDSKGIGRIYVTTLNNYSMPLIRYDIGDLAVLSKQYVCHCGNNATFLEKVEGREMSVFKTKEDGLVPGEFFIHFVGVVFNEGLISKFQVIQEKIDLITIKVVPVDKEEFEKSKAKIEESIKKVMGKDCRIVWKYVKEIKPLSSGKYLYTISKV